MPPIYPTVCLIVCLIVCESERVSSGIHYLTIDYSLTIIADYTPLTVYHCESLTIAY